MNLFKHKFSKELDGLPKSRIDRIYKQYVKNTDKTTTIKRIAKTKASYLKEKDANNARRIRERQRDKNGYTATTPTPRTPTPCTHAPRTPTHAPTQAPLTPTQAPLTPTQAPLTPTHAPTHAPTPVQHQAPVEHQARQNYAVEVKAYERRLAEQRRVYRERQEQNERDARDEIEELRIQQLAERQRHEREIKALREKKLELSKDLSTFQQNDLSNESFNRKTADPDIERFKAELTDDFQEREQREKLDRAKTYTEKLILLTYPNIPDALEQVYNVRGRKYHAIVKKYTELKKEHEIHMVLTRENNGYKHEVQYIYGQSLRYGTPPFSELLEYLALPRG